jgi:hypothetical protein
MSLVGASTVMGIQGDLAQGKADQQAANFKAKTEMASGTRKAYEYKRQGDTAMSNARAAIAAGGGSTTDAGSAELMGKMGAQTDYNALSALYEGQTNSDIAKYEGQLAKHRSRMKATSTLLSGAAGMYKAYKNPAGFGDKTKKNPDQMGP